MIFVGLHTLYQMNGNRDEIKGVFIEVLGDFFDIMFEFGGLILI